MYNVAIAIILCVQHAQLLVLSQATYITGTLKI